MGNVAADRGSTGTGDGRTPMWAWQHQLHGDPSESHDCTLDSYGGMKERRLYY